MPIEEKKPEKVNSDLDTLGDSIIINMQYIDEIIFPIKFFRAALSAYKLDEISNDHIPKEVPIIAAHPLAVLRGGDDIESKLPMIGIEQMRTSPHNPLVLGVNQTKLYDLTIEFLAKLESVPKDERAFPGSLLENLKQLYKERNFNENGSLLPEEERKPMYVSANSIIKSTGTKISLWTAEIEATRILKKVFESALIEFYRSVQKYKVKPEPYVLEPNLYNFDYGQTLYGCEFSVPYNIMNMNYIINIDVDIIKNFDIGVFDSDSCMFISPAGIPEEVFTFEECKEEE